MTVHQIIYSLRIVAPADWPTVRNLDGTTRPATDQDLLNMGMKYLNDDADGNHLFDCVEQTRRDPDTLEWSTHGPALPGTVLSQGSLLTRHAVLKAPKKDAVLRARVVREKDRLTIPKKDVEVTDTVEATDLIPHSWHGERRR